jgi:PPOX class probable F420-dependent enzyme
MCASTARDLKVSWDDLLAFVRPRHRGVLATERADGTPQLSPVTMGVDGQGRVVVSTYPERAKSRNARRSPRASMCVLSDDFGGDWVQVSGSIEVLDLPEGLDALVEYYRCISGEHSDWDDYRAAMHRQGKVLLRLTIDRWGPLSRGGFPPAGS